MYSITFLSWLLIDDSTMAECIQQGGMIHKQAGIEGDADWRADTVHALTQASEALWKGGDRDCC